MQANGAMSNGVPAGTHTSPGQRRAMCVSLQLNPDSMKRAGFLNRSGEDRVCAIRAIL